MKVYRLLIVFIIYSFSLQAQSFEGKIVYSILYKELPPEMQQMAGMLPSDQTIWIKGTKNRYEQRMTQGTTVVITDTDASTSTILMDMMGQKYKLEIDKAGMEKMIEEQKLPEIKYVEGSKTVAGYVCKKAEVYMEGFDGPGIFYYTEEIPPVKVQGMEALELKGMFMAYEITMQNMTMSIEASSIDKSPVSDELFQIPDGYSEMPAQIRAMMGIE